MAGLLAAEIDRVADHGSRPVRVLESVIKLVGLEAEIRGVQLRRVKDILFGVGQSDLHRVSIPVRCCQYVAIFLSRVARKHSFSVCTVSDQKEAGRFGQVAADLQVVRR